MAQATSKWREAEAADLRDRALQLAHLIGPHGATFRDNKVPSPHLVGIIHAAQHKAGFTHDEPHHGITQLRELAKRALNDIELDTRTDAGEPGMGTGANIVGRGEKVGSPFRPKIAAKAVVSKAPLKWTETQKGFRHEAALPNGDKLAVTRVRVGKPNALSSGGAWQVEHQSPGGVTRGPLTKIIGRHKSLKSAKAMGENHWAAWDAAHKGGGHAMTPQPVHNWGLKPDPSGAMGGGIPFGDQ